jgi:hypothetical protein
LTALKPLETNKVLGQVASRYPLNMFCAMPECPEPALDPHHIFPRSQIGSDLWFVQAWGMDGKEMFSSPLAHVIGLCREHHDDVEEHRAWIQLDESTLEFIWCERTDDVTGEESWGKVGPLDPQPGGRKKEHRPKKRFTSDEEVKRRKSISLKFPVGFDGLAWKELLAEAERVELEQEDTPFDPSLGKVGAGKLVITILERYVGRAAA